MAESIIFGAGKIGRGFLARLLYIQNEHFCFVEKSQELAGLMNKKEGYTIHVLGSPEQDLNIRGKRVFTYNDTDAVTKALCTADLVFTSVGGTNIQNIAPLLAAGIKRRFSEGVEKPLNIITCENWLNPAEILKESLCTHLAGFNDKFERLIGITESVVLCSGIENNDSPSAVNIQDTMELPVNGENIVDPFPVIPGFKLISNFRGFLERKLYTYNAANATVSYVGTLLGYSYVYEAASDPIILDILGGVYKETASALSKKHGIPLEEQIAFTRTSLSKLQDPDLVDTLERNAREPLRKLSPDDRLLGPARLALSYGEMPEFLCLVIAAAVHYTNPDDRSAVELANMRQSKGFEYVLRHVCKLKDDNPLFKQIIISKEKLLHMGILS